MGELQPNPCAGGAGEPVLDQGPPNEASVTIDWVGTCTGTTTTTHYNYAVVQGSGDVSIKSACRVAFQARAWAYCPAGVAP